MIGHFISRLWYGICWCVCWALARLMFGYRYAGVAHVPRSGPVLLASNHQSHLDPVLIGVASPRQLRFLARHELFFWPLSWLIHSLGAVPLDRGSGLGGLKATLRLLRDGEVVLVFPEGTRTADGTLGKLMPGICALARRSEAVIVPTAVSGAFAAMPRGSQFPRPRPVRLAFGPPIAPSQYTELSDDELVALVRSRIAACLETE